MVFQLAGNDAEEDWFRGGKGMAVIEEDKAAVALELELDEASLLVGAGQSAFCKRDPAKPPIRVWTSHMPDFSPTLARFH